MQDKLRNWNTLSLLVLAKWPKLHESDLKKIEPTLNELVNLIHTKYPDYPRQSIIEDVENLDEQILKNS